MLVPARAQGIGFGAGAGAGAGGVAGATGLAQNATRAANTSHGKFGPTSVWVPSPSTLVT